MWTGSDIHPLQRPAAQKRAVLSDPRAATATRVAIVEPDPTMACLLAEACRTSGYEVVDCGREAYARIIELARPDFLLLEFDLGEQGNGLDLIERVSGRVSSPFTIMITAWDINEIAGRIHGFQPDRILRKPVQIATIMNIMTDVKSFLQLNRHQSGTCFAA